MGCTCRPTWIIMEYYDLVLGSIPASFVGVAGTLGVLGVELSFAIPIAAMLALGVILHALFVRAPMQSTAEKPRPSTTAKGRSSSTN